MASREIYYKEQRFIISYEIVNPLQQEVIVILHGWGSNKEIMKQAFGRVLGEYKHIYIDMPGFGHSSSNIVLETSDYADIIKIFLNSININSNIFMGHSFGGKVATLIGADNLILLSSSGILVPKPLSVKLKIKFTKFLGIVGLKGIGSIFRSSDVEGMSQNMYNTFKNVVNEEFEHNFISLKSNTLLFWGEEDTATPLWTAKKIDSLVSNSKLYPLNGDHFFFLNHSEFISQTISRSLKNDIS
jgi:pimeloyl-ACP methyl ester carboxylesterase